MNDPQSPNDAARKADLQIRQELLETLGVPKGAAPDARTWRAISLLFACQHPAYWAALAPQPVL